MAEGKAANEDGDTCEDGIEEIESPHRADADEVEQCALHTQVSERLMQALEDSICAMLLLCFVGHKSLVSARVEGRYTPQSQLRTFTASTAIPVPAATPASAFFAPGSP